jgi:hypothetical protein
MAAAIGNPSGSTIRPEINCIDRPIGQLFDGNAGQQNGRHDGDDGFESK